MGRISNNLAGFYIHKKLHYHPSQTSLLNQKGNQVRTLLIELTGYLLCNFNSFQYHTKGGSRCLKALYVAMINISCLTSCASCAAISKAYQTPCTLPAVLMESLLRYAMGITQQYSKGSTRAAQWQ